MNTLLRNISLCLLTGLLSAAHAQTIRWLNHYGNESRSTGFKLAYDGASGLYGLGRSSAPSITIDDETFPILGDEDVLLIRWDTLGNVIWVRTTAGDCDNEVNSGHVITHDPGTGHVIICGGFDCSQTYFGSHVLDGSVGLDTRYLAAYDASGECVWARSFYSGYGFSVATVLCDENSNIFAMGASPSGGLTLQGSPDIIVFTDGFIAKYATDGTLLSGTSVVEGGALYRGNWIGQGNWVLAGALEPNGTIYGQSYSVTAPVRDGFVTRADTTGTIVWTTLFPSNQESHAYFALSSSDESTAAVGMFKNDLFLPGDTLHGEPGESSWFVAMIDAAGDIEWGIPVQSEGTQWITDAKRDANGDIYIYGSYSGDITIGTSVFEDASMPTGFCARISPAGACEAFWRFAPVQIGYGSVLPTNHGFYLSTEYDSTMVLGTTTVPHTTDVFGYANMLVARFDSLSGFSNVPSAMVLDGELLIYANPNNGLCTIDLPDAIVPGSAIYLRIYGNTGQLVQEVPVQLTAQGTVRLDIQAQAKGIYLVELVQGRQRYSGRIVFE